MSKTYCVHCGNWLENHSEYRPCPHCDARGPWGKPVENSETDEKSEERSPKLSSEVRMKVFIAYRASDAFQAGSMSNGSGRVIR